MSDAQDSTQMDDIPAVDNGPTEQELLDAVMKNSPIMDEVAPPLPDEEEIVEDPDESVDEDPETEEAVSEEEEEVEEEVEEAEDEDAGDEPATQEADVFTAEDLDLDAQVVVKIDGEEQTVSFGDLLKGYQTDAHLSKKGRELSEAQKALDTEKEEKLAEVEALAGASNAILNNAEQAFSKQYHDLEAKIAKARADGDTYELGELKDKREQAQKSYWAARQRREQLTEHFSKQKQEQQQKVFEQQLHEFHEKIPEMIPDFDEKVASDIRDFAIAEGIDTTLLDSVVDPAVVKFIDDYRRLKSGVKKGVAKRKAVPAKKAVPTKKAPPARKKAADKAKMVKARAFKEDASQEDQMDFLRQYASKSLNL